MGDGDSMSGRTEMGKVERSNIPQTQLSPVAQQVEGLEDMVKGKRKKEDVESKEDWRLVDRTKKLIVRCGLGCEDVVVVGERSTK